MKNEVNKQYTTQLEIQGEVVEPPLYQVMMHRDDFTPKEFVVSVLEMFFYMDRRTATDVMMEAHTKGKAICGKYTKDLAESLISQVVELRN